MIKGAGHMVNLEKPEEFNDALLAFWRQQQPWYCPYGRLNSPPDLDFASRSDEAPTRKLYTQ